MFGVGGGCEVRIGVRLPVCGLLRGSLVELRVGGWLWRGVCLVGFVEL